MQSTWRERFVTWSDDADHHHTTLHSNADNDDAAEHGTRDGLGVRNALVVTTDGTGMHAVRVAVADTDAGHLIVNAVLDGITVHAWRRPR